MVCPPTSYSAVSIRKGPNVNAIGWFGQSVNVVRPCWNKGGTRCSDYSHCSNFDKLKRGGGTSVISATRQGLTDPKLGRAAVPELSDAGIVTRGQGILVVETERIQTSITGLEILNKALAVRAGN